MSTVLHYIHDPMCSWCWGFRPCWDQIRAEMPQQIEVRQWLGGLAPDSEEPMPMALRATIQNHWRTIERQLGTPFNHAFWTECEPRRSTWIACRAVIAARNPSEAETLSTLATEIALDVQQFEIDLFSPHTNEQLAFEIQTSRQWPISGFPSLLIEHQRRIAKLPFNYADPGSTLKTLNTLVNP